MDDNVTKVWGQALYEIFKIIDECDNSSIDGTIWPTTSGAAEDTNGIHVTGQNKSFTGYGLRTQGFKIVQFSFHVSAPAQATSPAVSITANNAGFSVGANGSAGGGASNTETRTGVCTIFMNSTDDVNISVATYFDSKAAAGDAAGSHSEIRRFNGSGSGEVTLSGVTNNVASAGMTARIHWIREVSVSPSTTFQLALTNDDGATYVDCVNGGAVKFDTAGDTLRLKLTGTVAANELVSVRGYALGPILDP